MENEVSKVLPTSAPFSLPVAMLFHLRHISLARLKPTNHTSEVLTALALIFPSGPGISHSFVFGISITPSIIACPTCTPLGPNSLARLCASALNANFPVAKLEQLALPFTEAVAPVKISVGECSGVGEREERRSGRTAREKRKAPVLLGDGT